MLEHTEQITHVCSLSEGRVASISGKPDLSQTLVIHDETSGKLIYKSTVKDVIGMSCHKG